LHGHVFGYCFKDFGLRPGAGGGQDQQQQIQGVP
jgi:hypothetical protein